MKSKITATSTAIVSLIGISQAALADGNCTFTPVEDLAPEQRQEIFQQLSQLDDAANFDWENVVVGINEQGNLVFMKKSEAGLQIMAGPSTFSGFSIEDKPTK